MDQSAFHKQKALVGKLNKELLLLSQQQAPQVDMTKLIANKVDQIVLETQRLSDMSSGEPVAISDAVKLPTPAANTDPSDKRQHKDEETIKNQRKLKDAKKKQRQLESAVKKAEDPDVKDKAAAELKELNTEIALLERMCGNIPPTKPIPPCQSKSNHGDSSCHVDPVDVKSEPAVLPPLPSLSFDNLWAVDSLQQEQLSVTDSSPVVPLGAAAAGSTVSSPATSFRHHLPHSHHLHQRKKKPSTIHPFAAELALRVQTLQIVGGNCRTVALLNALEIIVQTTPVPDLDTVLSPPLVIERTPLIFDREKLIFCKEALMRHITDNMNYIKRARPFCAGMRFIEDQVSSKLDMWTGETDTSCSTIREVVLRFLSEIRHLVMRGHKVIAEEETSLVEDGDVILVFGRSSTVESVLIAAAKEKARKIEESILFGVPNIVRDASEIGTSPRSHKDTRTSCSTSASCIKGCRSTSISSNLSNQFKKVSPTPVPFSVIILDSPPLLEGFPLVSKLRDQYGISVTYAAISSVCSLMPDVSKVFIGASSVMQSGDVLSRSGTAMITAVAAAYFKDVVCFCETYKFDRQRWAGGEQTINELLESCDAISIGANTRNTCASDTQGVKHRQQSRQHPPQTPVNSGGDQFLSSDGHFYDVTPGAHIAMIVSGNGRKHPLAVSSIVREAVRDVESVV